mmetsp:Transcript_12477/g.12562  ORF Transcript_12477/g.12562 Transcript_12477/m.12562 type:complete len:218 (-) Transcript_12477:310-963(-)|eukprot:CAMPEP_0182427656 /NCGR_PEP_ID=MMETSP1167-20130531/18949_1 /TAXON_ID=2988 /ORGANISM="Mallomonas Sp, Strain CCMP3275" /LENGTH=217 /DNA_ID=CAMNT_0024610043 /DNA_START=107 /DNA_END=760 /DNA_ORIENTATION=+
MMFSPKKIVRWLKGKKKDKLSKHKTVHDSFTSTEKHLSVGSVDKSENFPIYPELRLEGFDTPIFSPAPNEECYEGIMEVRCLMVQYEVLKHGSMVTQEGLKALFGYFGRVWKIILEDSTDANTKDSKIVRGIAHIFFRNPCVTDTAARLMAQTVVGNVSYYCSIVNKKPIEKSRDYVGKSDICEKMLFTMESEKSLDNSRRSIVSSSDNEYPDELTF